MKKRVLCLFDVDGTLTPPRLKIKPAMTQALLNLSKRVDVAYVGGSDYNKIVDQLDNDSLSVAKWLFSQNGLVAHQANQLIARQEIKIFLGQQKLKAFLKVVLHYLADIQIPIKRGTFVEYRTGMINISPIGRNCSEQERNNFEEYDKVHKIRDTMINYLKATFPQIGLQYSIGGKISFDVFPQGWDKRYCLRFVEKDYDEIYFFGDKCDKGGNDHQIYEHFKLEGTAYRISQGYEQTITELEKLFLANE